MKFLGAKQLTKRSPNANLWSVGVGIFTAAPGWGSGHNDFFVVGVFYREASLNRDTKCVS